MWYGKSSTPASINKEPFEHDCQPIKDNLEPLPRKVVGCSVRNFNTKQESSEIDEKPQTVPKLEAMMKN